MLESWSVGTLIRRLNILAPANKTFAFSRSYLLLNNHHQWYVQILEGVRCCRVRLRQGRTKRSFDGHQFDMQASVDKRASEESDESDKQ